MTDKLKLAERCEKATGPDRELDGDIFATVVIEVYTGKAPEPWPLSTSSLDAAMTLLEAGWFFHVSRFTEGGTSGGAHVYPNRFLGDDYESDAATLALALTAAALRALAANEALRTGKPHEQ